MTTNIVNSFDDIYLSSHLPETVNISTSEVSVEFILYVDGVMVFSSVYYPINHLIQVRDIRSIIEAAMFDQELSIATLTLEAKQPDGDRAIIEDVKVICCSFKSTLGSETFLRQNFLTTRKSALIPRGGKMELHNYTQGGEQGNNRIRIIYRNLDTGLNSVGNFALISMQSSVDAVKLTTLNEDYCKSKVGSATNCKIYAAELRLGARAFNLFFTDETPTDEFAFINAFNVQERVYLFGATTTKTEVNRSEAVVGKRTQFYDETVTVLHEVETAPLPFDEAMWMSQMFTSKRVNRILSDNQSAEVLITDITSEVTDDDKELIKLKFSWKYADGVEWIK